MDHLVPAATVDEGVKRLVAVHQSVPANAITVSKRLMARSVTASFDELFAASLPLLRDCLDSLEAAVTWRSRRRRQL